MTKQLPFDVTEAAIAVAGKAFFYKGPFRRLILRAGVPTPLFDRFADQSKYAIARNIFSELDGLGEAGAITALRIIEELCSIRSISDDNVDKRSALIAIQHLRDLCQSQRIDFGAAESARAAREQREEQRLAKIAGRDQALRSCHARFLQLLSDDRVQKRGYAIEELFRDLCQINELTYRSSYRGDAEQIDGAFRFNNFDYLVETKWTREEAALSALDTFRSKVSRKLASTRGLFISIAGFADHVVSEFERGPDRCVILMSGEDLTLILEGRLSLIDALELKATHAAQKGNVFVRLAGAL